MQIVGKNCGGCGEKIIIEMNVTFCSDCQTAFHNTCIDTHTCTKNKCVKGSTSEEVKSQPNEKSSSDKEENTDLSNSWSISYLLSSLLLLFCTPFVVTKLNEIVTLLTPSISKVIIHFFGLDQSLLGGVGIIVFTFIFMYLIPLCVLFYLISLFVPRQRFVIFLIGFLPGLYAAAKFYKIPLSSFEWPILICLAVFFGDKRISLWSKKKESYELDLLSESAFCFYDAEDAKNFIEQLQNTEIPLSKFLQQFFDDELYKLIDDYLAVCYSPKWTESVNETSRLKEKLANTLNEVIVRYDFSKEFKKVSSQTKCTIQDLVANNIKSLGIYCNDRGIPVIDKSRLSDLDIGLSHTNAKNFIEQLQNTEMPLSKFLQQFFDDELYKLIDDYLAVYYIPEWRESVNERYRLTKKLANTLNEVMVRYDFSKEFEEVSSQAKCTIQDLVASNIKSLEVYCDDEGRPLIQKGWREYL